MWEKREAEGSGENAHCGENVKNAGKKRNSLCRPLENETISDALVACWLSALGLGSSLQFNWKDREEDPDFDRELKADTELQQRT